MTLLVVGASGLLGGNVVVAARERDERVRGTHLTAAPPGAPAVGTGEERTGGAVETVRLSFLWGLDRVGGDASTRIERSSMGDLDAVELSSVS